MAKIKTLTLTMDEKGQFKIDGNIEPVESIGFLEYAKAVLLRDAIPPNAITSTPITEKSETENTKDLLETAKSQS